MADTVRGDKAAPITETMPGQPTLAGVVRWFSFGLPVTALAIAGAVGSAYGLGTAILVLAGGVLIGIIAILWTSVRTLSGDAPFTIEEAMALAAPSAAEEEKRAVLQALKDLDYERSVGKIADADYEELLRRYRTEAKRLLRAVDVDLAPLRAKAAAYVAERSGRAEAPVAPAAKAKRACPSCKVDNDIDAVFCKKCGGKLESVQESRDATA